LAQTHAAGEKEAGMEVGAGVRRIGNRYISCYLIEEGGRLTLLDAGLPGYWGLLLQEIGAMGRRLEDIDAVLVTHSHPDHFGTAERVRSASGAKVYAHPLEIPVLTGKVEGKVPNFFGQGFKPFLFRYVIHALSNGVTKRVPIAAVNEFADGEIVQVPGSPRVVHAPGHTAGACALHLKDRDILFSGDTLVTIELLTGQPRPTLPADFVNENSSAAFESLARLEKLEASTVLPGHGEPWKGGVKQAVELARAATREWVKPPG
jgi:glyoxylase-like metal-dependent hydrolase (beta-lactamase superfamily II)